MRSMSPGSLPFAKLGMTPSTPAKYAGDARYASQDPFIQSTLSHTISSPLFLRQTQQLHLCASNVMPFKIPIWFYTLFAMVSKSASMSMEDAVLHRFAAFTPLAPVPLLKMTAGKLKDWAGSESSSMALSLSSSSSLLLSLELRSETRSIPALARSV